MSRKNFSSYRRNNLTKAHEVRPGSYPQAVDNYDTHKKLQNFCNNLITTRRVDLTSLYTDICG
jgi:hypothetical protein